MQETLPVEHIEFRLPSLKTPLTEPIIVIDTAKIAPYFKNFRNTRKLLATSREIEFAEKVATQVDDVYHAKAGSYSIVEFVPSDIPVISAFKRLPEMIAANERRGQEGKVDLHIGTPDKPDLIYDFLQVPEASAIRKQAIEIRKSLGLGGRAKLQSILKGVILDGSHPASMEFTDYAREIKRIFPKASLIFKISAELITRDFSGLVYAAKKGLGIDQVSNLMTEFPWFTGFGIDLYIGNPLDESRINKIIEFVQKFEPKNADHARSPRVSSFYIGGIGGYGDEIPHEQMLDLFNKIWTKFPKMQILVEHGKGAVERIAYALFPSADTSTIAQYLPDYKKQPDNLNTETVNINSQVCTMVHNVGYLDTQKPQMKVEVLR